MMSRTGVVVILVLGVLMTACKSKKNLAAPSEAPATSKSELYTILIENQPDFSWFTGKGRVRAETDDAAIGATIHLRMVRDSVIWMSFEKFGFEMGRALCSPDSIWVIDRLNKEYYSMEFDSTMRSYGAPFSFSDLQSVLAGGTVYVEPLSIETRGADDSVSLRIEGYDLSAEYWFSENRVLQKGVLQDRTGRRVEIENSDYRAVGSSILPFEKYLAMFGFEDSARLRFEFADIQIDVPKSLAFNIPSHYDRVD